MYCPIFISFTDGGLTFKDIKLRDFEDAIHELRLVAAMQGDYKVALRGDLTIYPKSGEEFDKIFGITNLIKRLVQTSVPRSITSVKGVIREVPVKESEDQLLELLSARYSSCMEARRATRAVDGKRVNTGTVILTFTDALPNSVLLGSRSFPVTTQ